MPSALNPTYIFLVRRKYRPGHEVNIAMISFLSKVTKKFPKIKNCDITVQLLS